MSQNTYEGQSVNGLTNNDNQPIPAPEGFVDETVMAAVVSIRNQLNTWNNTANLDASVVGEIDDNLNHLLNLPKTEDTASLIGELTMLKTNLLNAPAEEEVAPTPDDDTPFRTELSAEAAVETPNATIVTPNNDITISNGAGVTVTVSESEEPAGVDVNVHVEKNELEPPAEPEETVPVVQTEVTAEGVDIQAEAPEVQVDIVEEAAGVATRNEDLISDPEAAAEAAEDAEEVVDSVAALKAEEAERMEATKPKPQPASTDGYNTMAEAFVKAAEAKKEQVAKQQAEAPDTAEVVTETTELIFDFQFNKRTMQKSGIVRADGDMPNNRTMVNYALSNMLKDYLHQGKVPNEVRVSGIKVRMDEFDGVWEEGGSTRKEGSVILATDPEGRKISPLTVYTNGEHSNGRHAMVPVQAGYYLVMGGWSPEYEVLAVYLITDSVLVKTKNGSKEYPKLIGELVGYMDDPDGDFLAIDGMDDEELWSPESAAIQAAWKRMREINAGGPCYVRDYRVYYPDLNDIEACAKDKKFRAMMQNTNVSLEDAYHDLDDVLAAEIAKGVTKDQFPLMNIIFNYHPQQNAVSGHLLGVVYDQAKKTSAGKRLIYRQFLMQRGDTFYYPDKDPDQAIDYERIVQAAVGTQGSFTTVFRRMTK